MAKRTLRERFESKVSRTETGCWEWTGARSPQGYGMINVKRNDGRWIPTTAHRVAYELHVAAIPPGLELDHLCRNRGCVNPEHLEAVTHRVNDLRGTAPTAVSFRENRCLNGHPFTPENTITRRDRPNSRSCRRCKNAHARARGAKPPL